MSFARDHARRIVAQTADGWLVGFDAGEWGGSLWWYPTSPGAGVRLSGRNVRAIVETTNRSFLVLLAWGYDWTVPGPNPQRFSGSALTVANTSGAAGWHIVNQVELHGNPTDIAADPSGFLIATTGSVEHLSHAGTVRVLSSVEGQENGFATLAMGPGGTIAVGRRLFVQLLTPSGSTYHDQWLVPSECTRFRYGRGTCECIGPS